MYHNGLKYGYTPEATRFFSDRHVLLAQYAIDLFPHVWGIGSL